MLRRILILVGVVSLWGGVARAQTEKSWHASFTEGLSIETSGVHGATGGILLSFGRVSVDLGFGIQVWSRWLDDRGTRGRALDFGTDVRVNLMGREKARGPYVFAGSSYMRFLGDAEKKLNNLLGRADIGPNGFVARVGAGYGFPTTKRITIAVKFEISYWMYEGGDSNCGLPTPPHCFPPEAHDDHPNPLVFHIGLEFMRWM